MSQETITDNEVSCQGCLYNQANQLGHMGPGGCLEQCFCLSCGEEITIAIDDDVCSACWLERMRNVIHEEEDGSESEDESSPKTPEKTQ